MKKLVVLLCLCLDTLISSGQISEKDSLLNIFGSQEGKPLVQSLNDLSWYYRNIDLDSAMMFAQRAIEESNLLEDNLATAASLNSLATVYEAKGQLDSALTLHNRALSLKLSSADSTSIGTTYNNLGIVYDELGQHEKSLHHYHEAIVYFNTEDHDPFKLAMVYSNIGIVLKKQKQFDKALEHYQRALGIYREQSSDFGIAVTTGNVGSLYIQLGKYQESIVYSEESKSGYEDLGYGRYVPYPIHNMAIAMDSLRDYVAAEALYQEALRLHFTHDNNYELASTYTNLANNQARQGKRDLSIATAEKAIEYSDIANNPEFKVRALKIMAASLAALGNYSSAYDQLLTSTIGQDSLFEKDKTRAIIELETKYETAQKEQQINIQEATIREQDLIIERNRILLAGSGLVIVLVIGVGLLFWRNERLKRAKMREELKAQRERDQMTAVISSQENERKRFAADIHDGFGQLISILKINLSSLDKMGDENVTLKSRQELYENSVKIIDDMYEELRNVCFNIMPQTLVKRGLPAALKEFADRLNIAGKVRAEVLIYGLEDRLEDIQEISIYRITQEVVNNILKYADARQITIQLTHDDEEITLMIEDDGMGFNPKIMQEGKGNGWKNLQTRSNFINGHFEYDSSPERRGTTFVLNLPVSSITYEPDTVIHG